MCASRKFLIKLLQTEFQKDSKLANECISSAQDKAQNGLATRFFNKFPCMIATNELVLLTHELRRMVVCIDPDSIVENKNTFTLLDENDTDDIFEWQMKIISLAASTLLDEKSCVNTELLQLFNLQHLDIDAFEMLSAFVAHINEHIALQFEKQFKQTRIDNEFVFNMIFMHVNKRYGEWIKSFVALHNDATSANNHFVKPLENIILKLNQSSRKIYALKEEDKKPIREWQLNMIKEIIEKSLDEEGQIKDKFPIGYSNKIKITPHEFIYIYLDILNNYITESQKTLLEKNSHLAQLILDYIKIHKSSWIKDELPNAGYVVIPKINFARTDYQSRGVLLVLGASLATASVSYAGYMFFKNAKEGSKLDLEKNNHKTLVM